ncbi:MAG: galactokinase [Acidobacteria bacterium]|nr:galactokinase [Acidobacteriota bacterium]MCA1649339.1 galactokinase [Acidobacteriota bacterium]
MTGAHLASSLVDRGLSAAEQPAKASLYDLALAAWREQHDRPPEHAWWVPGRLEVFGKHTDYAGGRTIVAAVPRGFAFLAGHRDDDVVCIVDARSGDRVTIQRGATGGAFTGWRHYTEVVFGRLARNFPGAMLGAQIVFASDLPRASGMSSSSALVVGLATALARLWELPDRSAWIRNIRGCADLASYFACIENGLTFGTLIGDAGVGTHGGSEDHAAMLCAQPKRLSGYAFVPMRHLDDVIVPTAWQFVVASSGVTAEKTGGAQEAYNRLAEAVRVLLHLWNADHERQTSLADAVSSAPPAAATLLEAVNRSAVPGWTSNALADRLEHFVREDGRVSEALEAFRNADAGRIGVLAVASQQDAERLLGNQIAETTSLARLARKAGAFAACGFGAGFGGSVWALVEAEAAGEFAARWLAAYRAEYPTAVRSVTFVATPGPALTQLSP